jgi:hypothetical protein
MPDSKKTTPGADISPDTELTRTSPPSVTRPADLSADDGWSMKPGQRLGRYQLEHLLGRGGMGEVYRAEDLETGRQVALKVLRADMVDAKDRARFLREGRLAASISHPHTVYVYETDEVDGCPIIAMELAEGGSLKDRVKQHGPMAPEEAVELILQVASGLEAAAAVGVLHRDIKPANIFFGSDGQVKVGDFGLSIPTEAREETYTQLTTTGSLVGTPAYASPEQLSGERLDVRSDIYAVGATLYYLLTGRSPFDQTNIVKLLTLITHEVPESPLVHAPGVPKGLANVVMRCLEKTPEKRFADYQELSAALVPYRSQASVSAPLPRRLLAGFLDGLVTAPVAAAIPVIGVYSAELLTLSASAAYFALAEGVWGRSLGKWSLGLRVTGPDGGQPGLGRAAGRAVLYVSLSSLLVPFMDPTAPSGGLVAAAFILGFLPFVSARPRNGFLGLHGRLTGTRVIYTFAREGTRQLATASGAMVSPPDWTTRIGPYLVPETSAAGPGPQVSVAYDDRLRRHVWLHVRDADAAAVPPARRDLGRRGRVRWVSGAHAPTLRWDAYEAPRGASLESKAQEAQPWDRVRFWLRDLALEIQAATRDGALPALGVDRVWITDDGRALLLDWPAPGSASPGEVSPPSATPDLRSIQSFLGDVANLSMHRGSAKRDRAISPPPLGATRFLQAISEATIASCDAIVDALTTLTTEPTSVTRRRRGMHMGISMVLPSLLMAGVLAQALAEVLRSEASFVEVLLAASTAALFVLFPFVALPGLLSAAAVPGGSAFRALGVAIVERDGTEVSRGRGLWRASIAWLPMWSPAAALIAVFIFRFLAVGLPGNAVDQIHDLTADSGAIAGFIVRLEATTTPSVGTFSSIFAGVGFVVFLAGMVWAVVTPQRGFQDRLAGTWLVPRPAFDAPHPGPRSVAQILLGWLTLLRGGLMVGAVVAVLVLGFEIERRVALAEQTREVVWVNADGQEEALRIAAGRFQDPSLSPDGRRLALSVETEDDHAAGNHERDIWVFEVETGDSLRLTTEGNNRLPTWSSDGTQIFFNSTHDIPQPDVTADWLAGAV